MTYFIPFIMKRSGRNNIHNLSRRWLELYMTNFVTNRKLILKTILLVKLRSANFKPEPLNLAKGEGGEKQKETLGPTIKEKS